MALLANDRRIASALADTEVSLWRVPGDVFAALVTRSPRLAAALEEVARGHRAGLDAIATGDSVSRGAWRGTVLRTLDARRTLHGWQIVMLLGFATWLALALNETAGLVPTGPYEIPLAALQLVAGLTVIQGACEAFILAVERAGARLGWDGFLSGTVGSLVATLPEFVVIAFLVSVDPLAAFVTAAMTIFNNALAFSVYSFFLPKDQKGRFLLPTSLARAGGEVLVAGSGIAMIVGVVMLIAGRSGERAALSGADLLLIGVVLVGIYAYYVYELLRYYARSDEEEHPGFEPDPGRLGHDTSWRGIASMFALGIAGAYVGGESIGGFADTALNRLGLPTIPTAAGLAFFAGISEYIIVWKAHRRGELGIALSNVFGGMTQVMFLLLPFAMLAIAAFGALTGSGAYVVPIDLQTTFLMLLLFPLFYVLLQYLREDHTLSNLDAAAMTGIYALLLYFLFTA